MNITGVSTLSTAVSATTTNDPVSIAVLKKALAADAQSALSLINGIPAPSAPPNLPPNLGRTINTTA